MNETQDPSYHTNVLATGGARVHRHDNTMLELERQGGGAVDNLYLHLTNVIVCPLLKQL